MKYPVCFFRTIFVFTIFLFLSNSISAQNCSSCRYISPVFDSITITTVKFAEGPNSNNQMLEIYMDIYEPYGDTATKRPVVIFAFGGGFVQGSKNDWYVEEVCKHLTKAGYVCSAIDYRIGISAIEVLTLQHMRIFFRPMQDMRAAVQYLKADFAELGNNYRIDTSKIIIGGASAGAITALMTAYCDKPSEMEEMGNLSALDALGGFYSTTGLYPNYSWKSAAVFNVAGALVNADWIEPGDIPLISAHGNQDQVVPYDFGIYSGLLGGFFDLQGSYVVDLIAQFKGVCSYLFTMEGHDHPSLSMGMDYIRGVVNQLMLRMHAVINKRTFCCDLALKIHEHDTLIFQHQGAPVTLNAQTFHDQGNPVTTWCAIPCLVAETSPQVTFQPDTALHFLTAVTKENQCQSSAMLVMQEGEPSSLNLISSNLYSVYPHPNSGVFSINGDFSLIAGNSVTIEILNLNGQLVYREMMPTLTQNHLTVHAGEIPGGTYLLKIHSGDNVPVTNKLVVIR